MLCLIAVAICVGVRSESGGCYGGGCVSSDGGVVSDCCGDLCWGQEVCCEWLVWALLMWLLCGEWLGVWEVGGADDWFFLCVLL